MNRGVLFFSLIKSEIIIQLYLDKNRVRRIKTNFHFKIFIRKLFDFDFW